MNYSKVYKNINKKVQLATKELIKEGFWKANFSQESKIEMSINWLEKVAKIYKVDIPKFEFIDSLAKYHQTGGGQYNPNSKVITLFHKFSFTTLLHEFRHHMQHENNIKMYKNDLEEDARAWSVSLFKLVAPKSYKKAHENGTIRFS